MLRFSRRIFIQRMGRDPEWAKACDGQEVNHYGIGLICVGNDGVTYSISKAWCLEEDDEALNIEKVIFNDPATIILWRDGDKTVVKRAVGDVYDPYAGFCIAVAKKAMGNNSRIKKILREKSNYEEAVMEE